MLDADERVAGLITLRDIEGARERPNASKDERGRLRVAAAVGVRGRLSASVPSRWSKPRPMRSCSTSPTDTPTTSLACLAELREAVGADVALIAGNVATFEGADDLCRAGADAVKVGVGPGSACTTRVVAGVGVPQLTAVIECVRAASAHGVPVIADGGIRVPGDVAKALAAGADTVMVGNLLAGTDESPGDVVRRGAERYKVYRGMASAGASARRAEVDSVAKTHSVPEGVEAVVPYRGPAATIVGDLVGGLRSAMSYAGATTLEEFRRNARFVRITSAGLAESLPHDLHQP